MLIVSCVQTKEGLDTPNEQDGALTQLTLAAIAKHMQKGKRDEAKLPVSSHHPFLNSYKSGKAFVDVPEKAANDLELAKISRVASSADYKGSQTLFDIQDELAFIKGMQKGIDNDLNSKPSAAQRIPSIDKGKAKLAANIPSRRVIQWQISRLHTERDSFFSSAQQLIDQFVSKHYPHPLLRKCWGAFDAINEVCYPKTV
jgi:hypothetical protein